MCTVKLHVFCYTVVLYNRNSKLTVLIYTGVRYLEQSLIGVLLDAFKVFMSCFTLSLTSPVDGRNGAKLRPPYHGTVKG
jgi:hypothetical protein